MKKYKNKVKGVNFVNVTITELLLLVNVLLFPIITSPEVFCCSAYAHGLTSSYFHLYLCCAFHSTIIQASELLIQFLKMYAGEIETSDHS